MLEAANELAALFLHFYCLPNLANAMAVLEILQLALVHVSYSMVQV
jgi:hypothetical protein